MRKLVLSALVFALIAVASRPLRGQDPVAKNLGLTAKDNALPLWTKPDADARQALGKLVRTLSPGALIVGNQNGHGSSWVISKKNRLLVTNAHVADIAKYGKMYAILNGSNTAFDVEKIWYHPGVRRILKTGESVRSSDPREGHVDSYSPDLAVLKLAKDGPDLPFEFPMASPEDIKELFGQPVAILGFPGHDTRQMPKRGEFANASYHDGVVSRLTDFRLSPTSPNQIAQFVQYTMATWPGFSGSPVFLPNGRVVAVHNMAPTVKHQNGVVYRTIPHGVRADCVWEMLVHHKLEDLVPFKIDKAIVNVQRWLEKDEKEEKLRETMTRVLNLVADARYLIYTKEDFVKGVEKCNEAIRLMPNYPESYHVRSHGFTNYWFKNRRGLDNRSAVEMLNNAHWDAKKFVRLSPTSPDALQNLATVLNNFGSYSEDNSYNREALKILVKLGESDNLTLYNQANVISSMGVALDNLGEKQKAAELHRKAIGLQPDEPVFWETRADYWHYRQEYANRDSDNAQARLLRKMREIKVRNGYRTRTIMKVAENLTSGDPRDTVRKNSYCKTHTVKLQQGATYQIDLRSQDFDAFLRLEDAAGNQVAFDDDGGGLDDARIFITAAASDTYRIVVTTYKGGEYGGYNLSVVQIGEP